jgi:FkbM family methyltransferase
LRRGGSAEILMIWFLLTRLYSRFSWFLARELGWRTRGLGWCLRHVGIDAVVLVHGTRLFFDHRVSSCYAWLVGGEWNEPETHEFLHAIIDEAGVPLRFVDVGANVGEMVVDIARLANVHEVVAFEPDPYCARAMRVGALLNDVVNLRVVERVLRDEAGPAFFTINTKNPLSHRLAAQDNGEGVLLPATTLDTELRDGTGPTIVLIDVEGAELLIMRGGQEFIRQTRPLLIFEYNKLGRAQYDLDAVRAVLGDDYDIFRLGPGGLLHRNLKETWNCVAVNRDSIFRQPCMALLRD